MKPYCALPCANLQDIVDQTLNYLNAYTDLLDPNGSSYWNKINSFDFIKHVPALISYFNTLKLRPREVAVLTANKNNPGLAVHIDELPVTAKINIPILNIKGSRTSWHDIPQSVIEQQPVIINQFGAIIPDLSKIDLKDYPVLADIELTDPIVFNSQIPHMVTIDSTAVLPRVVLSVMFFEEPIAYLQD